MRTPLARVVLGACLGAAAAAAQAPASSATQGTQGSPSSPGGQISPGSQFGPGNRFVPGSSGTGSSSTGTSGNQGSSVGSATGARLRSPQDDVDYSLRGQFRQYHGEFMDRHERYNPAIELRARVMPKQSIRGEPGTFDMLGYDFDGELPAVITTESYLLFGAYHYGRRYVTSSNFGTQNNPGGGLGDETLTAAGVRLGFGWFLGDNVLLEVETNPGVYSDLETGLTHKDYDFPSSALFTVRATNDFFFKIGGRYNQIYRDAPWLPYLGFSWEIVEGLRFDLLLPEQVELSWWPSASTGFLLGTQVTGAQYSVSTGTALGRQRADVQVQEVMSYLGLIERFSDNVSLTVRAGLIDAGDYRLTTGAAGFDLVSGALAPRFFADVTFGIDW